MLILGSQLAAQSYVNNLVAPIFYEFGVESGYQNNPLNLSTLEIEKAAADKNYLEGIEHSTSNVISLYGKLNYAPRLFNDRRTRVNLIGFMHHYADIQERSYQSFSLNIKQSLGSYRYLELGYGILPELYLRNYLHRDPATQILARQACSFGSERFWLGLEHRLNKKNRLEYRLLRRSEIYSAPFAAYDMAMLEGSVQWRSSQISGIPFSFEAQYGISENDNDIDSKDRSYRYLNLRPSISVRLPGKHVVNIDGRYDQRAYNSEANEDPLHAGRYQDEFRIDLRFKPQLEGDFVIEPFVGYRERRVDSTDPAVAELKSFTRYWFGVRLGFKSVIDMYL
jgi:hypothetical protein